MSGGLASAQPSIPPQRGPDDTLATSHRSGPRTRLSAGQPGDTRLAGSTSSDASWDHAVQAFDASVAGPETARHEGHGFRAAPDRAHDRPAVPPRTKVWRNCRSERLSRRDVFLVRVVSSAPPTTTPSCDDALEWLGVERQTLSEPTDDRADASNHTGKAGPDGDVASWHGLAWRAVVPDPCLRSRVAKGALGWPSPTTPVHIERRTMVTIILMQTSTPSLAADFDNAVFQASRECRVGPLAGHVSGRGRTFGIDEAL